MEDGTTPNLEIDIVRINDLYEGGAVYALAEEVPGLLRKLQQIFEDNQRMHHTLADITALCMNQRPNSNSPTDWYVDAFKRKVMERIDKYIDKEVDKNGHK